MPGLKKHEPSIRFSANKITPDEIDQRIRYTVQNPSVSASYLGTVTTATTTGGAFVMDSIACDYPRNLLFTLTGVAGGMGGTMTATGTDQFNRAQTESIGFGSAASGGTLAGTKIFDTVTSATLNSVVGVGGTAVGTASLGFAIGTAATQVAQFGLPVKIKAVGDVKRITWNDSTVQKSVNGGTVNSTYVGTATHSFNVGQVVAAADAFHVDILTTYTSENDANVG